MLRRLPLLLVFLAPLAHGQGVMQPLTIQGLEQQESATVRSRGMGSVFAAMSGSPESVVLNPAGLASLPRPALSASGIWRSRNWAETQHWNPNRYYAGISLYFSDPEDYRSEPLSLPDWTQSQQSFQLATLGGAIPLRFADRIFTVGVMLHQVAYLADYDQNNNVLEPYIGQFRPDPVERPKPGEEIEVLWSAFERERTGNMQAVSAAFGFALLKDLHIGARISRSWGNSTDRQSIRDIGTFLLREDAHDYSYEVSGGQTFWNGSSDFIAWRSAIGIRWQHQVLSGGIIYELPYDIEHTYSRTIDIDSVTEPGNSNISEDGQDEIRLPARIVAGIAIRPVSQIVLAADYFWQNYETLEKNGGSQYVLPDWGRVQGIGLGVEWNVKGSTILRAGFRRDPRPFRIEGFGLVGKTATGDAISTGFGTDLYSVTLDVAYELQLLHYQDRWESNVDYNRIRQHNVLFGVTYSF